MIKNIKLQNFKCFDDSPLFQFSGINLLTGINGRGKSSLLQSLLVLSQSAWQDPTLSKLVINGLLVQLGNFDDIKNSETPRNTNIVFHVSFDEEVFNNAILSFKEIEGDSLQADCSGITIDNSVQRITEPFNEGSGPLFHLSKKLKKIHYISADRLGPLKYVDKTTLPSFLQVGARGENTINILANSINLPNVAENRCREGEARQLIRQAAAWLSYILDGAKIEIKGKENDSSVLYMLLNNKPTSFSYKPTNMGFGYSYVLPLIVAGLIAKTGEVIIVENPEAHLHPKAQSRITEFFSRVASGGVQVFIESHSEHILNGLRVSALDPEINISYSDLGIYYFNDNFSANKLEVDDKGKISTWPEGFFDQQETDLANIFRYSR